MKPSLWNWVEMICELLFFFFALVLVTDAINWAGSHAYRRQGECGGAVLHRRDNLSAGAGGGALNVLTPTYYNDGKGSIRYYDVPSFDLIEDYTDVLLKDGFAYDAKGSKLLDGEAPMLYVKNGDISYSIIIDVTTLGFEIFFIVK